MKIYKVVLESIEYETDGEEVEDLPEVYEVTVEATSKNDAFSKAVEQLSEDTGWLVDSCEINSIKLIKKEN
jgi:hypothetical protein